MHTAAKSREGAGRHVSAAPPRARVARRRAVQLQRACVLGASNEKPHGWAVAVTRKHGAAACGFYSEGAEVGPNHGGSRNAD